uniref:Mitochondrial carrier protein n=1 Tax=Steinernema glaseri TaxID=37863 RepID=A0A1I7YXE7_9BILA
MSELHSGCNIAEDRSQTGQKHIIRAKAEKGRLPSISHCMKHPETGSPTVPSCGHERGKRNNLEERTFENFKCIREETTVTDIDFWMAATTFVTDFVAGWVSGCSGLLIGHPFDTVKTRLQTSNAYNGILDCFRKTVGRESVRGLYKGMFAPFVSTGVMNSCMFVGYNQSLRMLHPGTHRDHIPMHKVYAAQLIGSLVQLIPGIPVEHIKTKLQVQCETKTAHFRGPWHCFRELLATGGIRALYRGGGVQVWRDCIGFMFYFPVYEKGKREIKKLVKNKDSLFPTIAAGGCAGSISWWVICPIEVVKNHIQTSTTSSKTFLPTARSIFASDGIRGFYKGGLVLLVRGFPVNALVFVVYEKIMAFGSALTVASSDNHALL